MAETSDFQTETINDKFRWDLLQKKALGLRAGKAFNLFRQNGIEPILIKGWAAGRLYPPEHIRLATDTDLAVAAADYPKAKEIATSDDAAGLGIDLHRELRHLDTLDWDDLVKHSRVIDDEAGSIRVLRPEDHLRVLCVHWLTDGGSDKERLWDIYYGVANRGSDFDWSRFLDVVSRRRRRWLTCAVGLAHRFLGLDLDDTPIKKEALDLPKWLVDTVESEWSADIKTAPLETAVHDRTLFLAQIKKRFNPNPLWATIQMEGSFDARTRFFYKVGNTLSRIIPSYRRISGILKAQSK